MQQSDSEGIAKVISATIVSIGVWAIAYQGLSSSIQFLRTIAILALIGASVVPAIIGFIAIKGLIGAAEDFFERKRRSALALRDQSSTKNKTIDPSIYVQIQALSKIKAVIDKHLETLARRRLMLVTVDHYGTVNGSAWNKEVQQFIDKVVRPELSEQEANRIAPNINATFQTMIEDRVRLRSDEIEADLEFSTKLTPNEFEHWCAKVLGAKGWKAITTKASGDQGADVVAEKEGTRIVLQCKLYSGTVGNKAVQEAYSAQRHYAAHASAVVTNSEFTPSARALANTTGVLLLHFGDLTRLDSLLPDNEQNHQPDN